MHLHGLVRTAELQESPAGSDQIELVLRVQGVGPSQPRLIVIPFSLLIEDPTLEPEGVTGRGFDADVHEEEGPRWVVDRITFAAKVLRASDGPKG
ncbi:MAG: hypothetical protein NVSMB9_03780 [Isosphaeraceae bacterium]